MARNKAQRQAELAPVLAPAQVEPTLEPRILEDLSNPTPEQEAADDAEIDAQIAKGRSVVGRKYKLRYKQRAREAGVRSKAAKRSAWDWLAETLAGECLNSKAKIDIEKFVAILDANAVDHSRWTNRSPGWEGRFRMTGRLALQRVVAETGLLKLPDGETLEAPADWIAKYSNA